MIQTPTGQPARIAAGLYRGVGQRLGPIRECMNQKQASSLYRYHFLASFRNPRSLPSLGVKLSLSLSLSLSLFFFPLFNPPPLSASTSLGTNNQTCVYCVWVWVCWCEENSVIFSLLTSACTRYRVIAHGSNRNLRGRPNSRRRRRRRRESIKIKKSQRELPARSTDHPTAARVPVLSHPPKQPQLRSSCVYCTLLLLLANQRKRGEGHPGQSTTNSLLFFHFV